VPDDGIFKRHALGVVKFEPSIGGIGISKDFDVIPIADLLRCVDVYPYEIYGRLFLRPFQRSSFFAFARGGRRMSSRPHTVHGSPLGQLSEGAASAWFARDRAIVARSPRPLFEVENTAHQFDARTPGGFAPPLSAMTLRFLA
jgi:hypothetical protein